MAEVSPGAECLVRDWLVTSGKYYLNYQASLSSKTKGRKTEL